MSRPRPALFLSIIFGVEVSLGILVVRDLHTPYHDAQQVNLGSVQGFHGIGDLPSQATRPSTFSSLTRVGVNPQVHYANQSRQISAAIARYRMRVRTSEQATAVSRRSAVELAAGLTYAVLFGSVAIWILQNDQMRRAVHAAKRQMDSVAFVCLELKTPLMAILSAGENVSDGLVGRREDLKEEGSIIVEQAARLLELVDEILLFAETATNKPQCAARALEVSKVLECALNNTAVLIQKSGFTVGTQIQPGLPPVVDDLSVISRSLQNLLANAVKYRDKERWIGLSAKLDETSLDGKRFESVRDRGIGIGSSDLPRIFEPFYRSSRVVAAQIHGMGLGLAIARSSAEEMGARLSVSSEVDRASVFTLPLPVTQDDRTQFHVMPLVQEVAR